MSRNHSANCFSLVTSIIFMTVDLRKPAKNAKTQAIFRHAPLSLRMPGHMAIVRGFNPPFY
jgi:hypothetical protein